MLNKCQLFQLLLLLKSSIFGPTVHYYRRRESGHHHQALNMVQAGRLLFCLFLLFFAAGIPTPGVGTLITTELHSQLRGGG